VNAFIYCAHKANHFISCNFIEDQKVSMIEFPVMEIKLRAAVGEADNMNIVSVLGRVKAIHEDF